MVQAFALDQPDGPLGVGGLPGGLDRGEDLPDTDRPDDLAECVAVGTIPIPQPRKIGRAITGCQCTDCAGEDAPDRRVPEEENPSRALQESLLERERHGFGL